MIKSPWGKISSSLSIVYNSSISLGIGETFLFIPIVLHSKAFKRLASSYPRSPSPTMITVL